VTGDSRALSFAELSSRLAAWGEPRYRAEQTFRWLHARGAATVDEMSDLPRALRDRMRAEAPPASMAVDAVQRGRDGTRKLRLRAADGRVVEAVLIPDEGKLTLCVSSQAGCALGCTFCATAAMGLVRHLGAGEIVDQVYRARALLEPGERLTNLVFMGMGEPLHNYDAVVRALDLLMSPLGLGMSFRRITLSTAGLVDGIARYGREPKRVNLAISLNATTDEVRSRIMPINRRWPIAELLAAAKRYPLEARRRLTFEYVLLRGVNDTDEDARRLPRLLSGLRCKVNLIPFNPHPDSTFERPERAAIERFQGALRDTGIATYLRESRGDDIDAACGQLAARAPAGAGPLVQLG
jgi:23S rRNA (adenine2503-C2)-methyltransferase